MNKNKQKLSVNAPYKKLLDYECAYDFVMDGKVLVCWVKYRESSQIKDVSKCELKGYYIDFGVRGIGYGSVEVIKDKEEQKKIFLKECELLEAEFVLPNITYCCDMCGASSDQEELFIMNESIYCIEHQLPF